MNYVFQDKEMENVLVSLKANLFDIIARNETRISSLEDAIVQEADPENEENLRNLWAQYNSIIKSTVNSANVLAESVKGLDAISTEYFRLFGDVANEYAAEQVNAIAEEQEATMENVQTQEAVAEQQANETELPQPIEEVTSEETVEETAEPVIQENITTDEVVENDTPEMVGTEDTTVEAATEEVAEASAETSEEAVVELTNVDEPVQETVATETTEEAVAETPVAEEAPVEEVKAEDEQGVDLPNIEEASTEETVENPEQTVAAETTTEEVAAQAEPVIDLPKIEEAPQEEAVVEAPVAEEATAVVENPTEAVAPAEVAPAAPVVADIPKMDETPVENTAEAASTPIIDLPQVESVQPNENLTANVAETTTEAVATVPAIEVPVAPEVAPANAAPEAPAAVVSTEGKVVYLKDYVEDDKAILVSQTQINKLKQSKDVQKALFQSIGNKETAPVSDEKITEAQLEEMMGQLPLLYEQGKTEEAEAMSERISVLSKKLQTAA